jgi:hypothetical protein
MARPFLVGWSLVAWLALKRPAFNMDRLLHRGKYAVTGDHEAGIDAPARGSL